MQKERFQEYLYNQDFSKSDISELTELMQLYPWFGTGALILLVSGKTQNDPGFSNLLKKYGLCVTNRNELRRMLQSVYLPENLRNGQRGSNLVSYEETLATQNSGFEDHQNEHDSTRDAIVIPSVLADDSLLDFSYSSKKTDVIISEYTSHEVTDSEEILNLDPGEDKDFTGSISEKEQNFNHWIGKLGRSAEVENGSNSMNKIIESFIQSEPGVIRADKVTGIQGDVSGNSAEENEGFITDTLAKIYVKQGLYNKAIYAYEKLCLKYPEKSIYFATQIEEIKTLYIKK